jgi:hypothetical protein
MNVADLIEKYAPEAAEFEVMLDGGEVFKFTAIQSFASLMQMKENGAKFLRTLRSDKCPPALAQFRDVDQVAASTAFYMHAVCIEPKWSQADWLNLATKAAWVFETLYQRMNTGQVRVQIEAEVDEVERLGESSSGTSGGATGSSSPGTSTESTQTNSTKRSKATSSSSSP